MHNPNLLELNENDIDAPLSALAILHGFGGRIFSYHESAKFTYGCQREKASATRRLWHKHQQQETYKDLQAIQTKLATFADKNSELTLVNELLMMALHVCLEDLLKFAGKSGEEEARQAEVTAREWKSSHDSRYAIWHAGQIIRAARALQPAHLVGFYATAVYHAAMTLWVYGLPSESRRLTDGPDSASKYRQASLYPDRFDIALDGAKTREVQAFLDLSHGRPGLMAAQGMGISAPFVPLEHSSLVIAVVCAIYRDNFSSTTNLLPPLVENLGNLMRDLGDLAPSAMT
jgi:hypothetical protein